MANLLRNPVLLEELEVRSRTSAQLPGASYEGPAWPLFMLGVPTLLAVLNWINEQSIWIKGSPWPLVACTALYTLYLAFAASRLGASTLLRDRSNLLQWRMLTRSVTELMVAKYLGAMLPLFIEVVLALPVVALLCFLGMGTWWALPALGLFWLGTVAWFGLSGMYWSATSATLDHAIQRARLVVYGSLFAVMFAAVLLSSVGFPESVWRTALNFNPVFHLWSVTGAACGSEEWTSVGVPVGVGAVTAILMWLSIKDDLGKE